MKIISMYKKFSLLESLETRSLIVVIAASILFPLISVSAGDDIDEWADNEWDKDSVDDDIIYGTGLIFGTNNADFIVGGEAFESNTGNTIFAKDGDDEIQSGILGDQVYGGDGEDTIQAGFGHDQLFGENGNDNVIGSDDDDYLLGGSGDDHLWGGFGDDGLRGGSGSDFFDCGEGIDEIKDFSTEHGDIRLPNCEIINTKN
jgi:Ca2+-binding RTX toxin-like protein